MTMDMIDKFEDLFVGRGATDFRKLESLVDVFCPFEAIGMVSQEIRHSNYLSYILDPNRPHGFGTTLLKGFLELVVKQLGGSAASLSKLDLHLMELSNVQVRREWQNIDLLIEIPAAQGKGLVVVIELKVNASESEDQLTRYHSIVLETYPSKKWDHKFVFLTKRGNKPKKTKDLKSWQPMAMATLIDRLQDDAKLAGFSGKSADLLGAYIEMMRRHHVGNAEIEDVAKQLWAKHREALDELMRLKPNILGDIIGSVADAEEHFAESVNKCIGSQIVKDTSTKRVRRFRVDAWGDIPLTTCGNGKWVKSKSLLLLEIYRSTVLDEIRITYCMDQDPKDEVSSDFRKVLFKRIRDSKELEALGKDRTSIKLEIKKGFQHLDKQMLWKLGDHATTELSMNNVVPEILDAAKNFVVETLPHYDQIIREVSAEFMNKGID